MQQYTEIPANKPLTDSRQLLLNNDKTVMSHFSGTSFPTQNIQVGMYCFRTDEFKMYQLIDDDPMQWKMVQDVNLTPTSKEYVDETFSPLAHKHKISDITDFSGHKHAKADITDFAHTHTATDLPTATTQVLGVVRIGAGLQVDGQGIVSISGVSVINPPAPKDGDVRVSAGYIYLYAGGWKQVFPAVYS